MRQKQLGMQWFQRVAAVVLLVTSVGCASANAQRTAPPNVANGRMIFQTGKNVDGVPIASVPPALKRSCAACHRPNGAGGVHLPGGAVSADLRYKSLVTGQTHPYTLLLLERAISTGIDNDGEHLDRVMPRWKLSERDLRDVAYYVLTQLK